MKIAVLGPTYPFRGGIAHYTSLLVQHLRERHQVLLVSYRKQYPQWLYPGNTADDPTPDSDALRVDSERILTPFNPLTWLRAFWRIKNYAPDLLILQWWTPFWSPMLFILTRLVHRFTNIKVLFLCHHIIPPEGGLFDWFLARRIFWRSHAMIVMSEEDFGLLRRGLPHACIKGTTIPPYDVLTRTPIAPAQARRKLGLGEDERVLLFFGFVRHYKGLRYLLSALPAVYKEFPVRLLVAGEFWEEERPYHELVEQLNLGDAVRFYNQYIPNEDLTTFFSAADVVVLPYLEATQSAVAQLALGFERPIIATSVGGMPETIHDGETGLIVSPGDAQHLSAAILKFYREDLARPFGENICREKESASWLPLVRLIEELAQMEPAAPEARPAPPRRSPRVL